MPPADNLSALADLAVESWRFAEEFRRQSQKLPAEDRQKSETKLKFFRQQLERCLASAGLQCQSLEGHPYDIGTAATALNLDEFAETDQLVIDHMIEPIVMGPAGVVRTGKAMVKKVGAHA